MLIKNDTSVSDFSEDIFPSHMNKIIGHVTSSSIFAQKKFNIPVLFFHET